MHEGIFVYYTFLGLVRVAWVHDLMEVTVGLGALIVVCSHYTSMRSIS